MRLRLGRRSVRGDGLRDDLDGVDRARVEQDAARDDAAHVEQVGDQLRQRRAVVGDQREALLAGRRSRRRTCAPGCGSTAGSRRAACAVRATASRGSRPWRASRSRPRCARHARFRAALRARARAVTRSVTSWLVPTNDSSSPRAPRRGTPMRFDPAPRAVRTPHARLGLERLPCAAAPSRKLGLVCAPRRPDARAPASRRGAPAPASRRRILPSPGSRTRCRPAASCTQIMQRHAVGHDVRSVARSPCVGAASCFGSRTGAARRFGQHDHAGVGDDEDDERNR